MASRSSPADNTVVNPASRNSCMRGTACSSSHWSGSPLITCRCASMKPGMTVRPSASITCAPPASAGTAETEAIRLPCTTTDPLSITPPSPLMILAFAITRFWPQAGPQTSSNKWPIASRPLVMRMRRFSGDRVPAKVYQSAASRHRASSAHPPSLGWQNRGTVGSDADVTGEPSLSYDRRSSKPGRHGSSQQDS